MKPGSGRSGTTTSSAERFRKVRGTVRASVSRNITLLTGLLRDADAEAREVNRQVTVLITIEVQICQSDKYILDVTEDEAVGQELEDAACYHEKIIHIIAEGQSFLNECRQSFHLRGTRYSPLHYVRDASRAYAQPGFYKNTNAYDGIFEDKEKDTKCSEGSYCDSESSLSAGQGRYENSFIEDKGNNTALGLTACKRVELPPLNSRLLATFRSDRAIVLCVRDSSEQWCYAGNSTGEEQPLEHCGNIPKWEEEPREQYQAIANPRSRNDGSCDMNDQIEEDERVTVNRQHYCQQLRKGTNEGPAYSLPTSNDDLFYLLDGEASSSVFLVVPPSFFGQAERRNFFQLSFEKLDDATTKERDGCLQTLENLAPASETEAEGSEKRATAEPVRETTK
ncbi:hypothetical protein HPB51_025800 [Rhipicephalus microplus]|uniref:Uncharacterized protein n=1 Tax=Rhipicephalus microplus TaxID=6941 RepID=A0A9J6DDX0_RHIMP|nr:hypothetical protein HPB51_025800 [Rhipicephalus microplus]